jgi:hypothetical protein
LVGSTFGVFPLGASDVFDLLWLDVSIFLKVFVTSFLRLMVLFLELMFPVSVSYGFIAPAATAAASKSLSDVIRPDSLSFTEIPSLTPGIAPNPVAVLLPKVRSFLKEF